MTTDTEFKYVVGKRCAIFCIGAITFTDNSVPTMTIEETNSVANFSRMIFAIRYTRDVMKAKEIISRIRLGSTTLEILWK